MVTPGSLVKVNPPPLLYKETVGVCLFINASFRHLHTDTYIKRIDKGGTLPTEKDASNSVK